MCEVNARGALAHLGFDVDLSLLACDRDAVMSIHHKIDLSYFVQHHGWQADLLVEGTIDALPARGEFVAGWQEDPVEFVVAVQAPHDLFYKDSLHPAIDGTANMQLF